MASNGHATAEVNLYEHLPHFRGVVRVSTSLRYEDGTDVRFSVPFSKTQSGETASMKYAREFRKVLDALSSGRILPYGERGWEVVYESGDALIGSEVSASYSGAKDDQRLDIEAFKKALHEVCNDPKRIKVSELYVAEQADKD